MTQASPDPDAGNRRRAAALAGHLGDDVAAGAATRDPDPVVRATGLGALARMGRLGLADVERAAADEAPEVRARAAELGAGLGSSAGVGASVGAVLVRLLDDRDPRVVESACFALGERSDAAGGVTARLSAVGRDHPDPLCREAAVAALGAIGDASGLPAILAATTDKPAVRRRAVLALAPFSGPDVDAALDAALSDRDWQVRQAAEDLTGNR